MNTSLQTINIASPIGSLEAYIGRVNSIPMLTQQQEQELAVRLQQEEDLEAARELVMAHLRFVVRIAKGYAGYGLSLADLIQEGNVGLMKAVKRFDPRIGVRLVSFAVHWIKAEIHEFIIRNWRIVKIATTKAQRKLFFNLRSAKRRLGWFSQDEIEDVAKELDVSPNEVREMEARLSAYDASFEHPVDEDEDEHSVAPVYYLEDSRSDPALQLETSDSEESDQQNLQTAMATLDTRSQHILKQRWLAEKKATLQELAAHYQVSAERIRQLEQAAMQKLKAAIAA